MNGSGIKENIENEVNTVKLILANNHIKPEDTELILGAVKELAYQWCVSNAHACALEQILGRKMTHVDRYKMIASSEYGKIYKQKMIETYPDYE